MEFTNAAWLQQPISDLQPVHDERNAASDDWKEPSTSAQASATVTQPRIDLSDFGLGDLQAPSSANIPHSSPPQAYYTFSHPFFLATTPGPYNAVPYGAATWPTTAAQLPLSSYSTLNGATTSSSPPQQQSQSQQMVIDPALTTMNASASIPDSHTIPVSDASTYIIYQSFLCSHEFIALSAGPNFAAVISAAATSRYPLSLRPTLSFKSIHGCNLTYDLLWTLSHPSSWSFDHSATHPLPEQRKASFLSAIRDLLQPTSFTGAGAVSQLVSYIEDYGIQEVDTQTRLEILTKMRDNAGNHYFRAWVENEGAMDITREWLKLAYTGKGNSQLVETIMPLLHIIDRLPLTIDTLKSSKLGKLIVRLVKEPPAPAIKDMASNVERKWRTMRTRKEETQGRSTGLQNCASHQKGRRFHFWVVVKTRVVKKEVKAMVREVKDAKSDSSFFSAPKPKPKLPSFKKAAAPAVKKEPDLNVAQPSSINPFEEALKSMAKSRKDSPAMSTPPPAPAPVPNTGPISTGFTKSGKLKKTVSWAPEGKLELIKLIERAVYDDDPADGMHTTHNVRDLDRDEGAALHAHLFEEQIEWSEPQPIAIPETIELRPKGEESQEKTTQEQRELGALVALYPTPAQIPDSPAEPPTQIPEEQVDENVRLMLTGPAVDSIFWSGGAPAALEPPVSSVAELVGQLAAASSDVIMGEPTVGMPPPAPSIPGLANFTPEQLQQLMQSVTQGGIFAGTQPAALPPAQGSSDQSWGTNQYSDYDSRSYQEHGRDRRWSEDGWNERGGPCSFFAAGRCRYGDQCDFSHEPTY
ncbi:hypothetical protein A0H81_08113 [Grifola frondosa]|uniref:C3H1-type domain-containing protein n=1 Tax=Grifola frondosa TaxID=5627 RepID=A0A1C7M4U4_GRIFR|nr:hypothetical protein A0H81_08113 [Grifola frondosa]